MRRAPAAGAAIADDSGLCVDALGGAPGVHSAHYAGDRASAATASSAGAHRTPPTTRCCGHACSGRADRRARFVSTLVALRHADDPEPLIASGRWEANLLDAPRGSGGFGYDPLVCIAALGASVAELDARAQERAQPSRPGARGRCGQLMREAWSIG